MCRDKKSRVIQMRSHGLKLFCGAYWMSIEPFSCTSPQTLTQCSSALALPVFAQEQQI